MLLFFQSVGHISGAHINPAITVATVILGKKSLLMAGFYIIAQCLGSLIGYGLLKVNEYAYIRLRLRKTLELCFAGHARIRIIVDIYQCLYNALYIYKKIILSQSYNLKITWTRSRSASKDYPCVLVKIATFNLSEN